MDVLGIGKMLAGVVNGFGERRDRKHERVHDENMEEGKRITGLDDNDAAYAIEQLKQQPSSWKDEYALFLVSIPAVLCFVKIGSLDGPGIVKAGFTALGLAPVWYQGLLVSIIAAAAGINEYKKHNQKMRLVDMKKKTVA